MYKRNGTANVFCGVEGKAGALYPGSLPTAPRPCGDSRNTEGDTIHLVMDNLSCAYAQSIGETIRREGWRLLWNRFTVLRTPTHGSWLDQAEISLFPPGPGTAV